jgi:predicted transcriptional regulator
VSVPGRLSGRERQILEILYQQGEAGVSEVRGAMEDPPSYSAVRTLIGVLEEKGHVTCRAEGLRYVYTPVIGRGS